MRIGYVLVFQEFLIQLYPSLLAFVRSLSFEIFLRLSDLFHVRNEFLLSWEYRSQRFGIRIDLASCYRVQSPCGFQFLVSRRFCVLLEFQTERVHRFLDCRIVRLSFRSVKVLRDYFRIRILTEFVHSLPVLVYYVFYQLSTRSERSSYVCVTFRHVELVRLLRGSY